MQKTLLFWCPHIGNVGTAKAVLESAKSLSQSKNYKCKILNSLLKLKILKKPTKLLLIYSSGFFNENLINAGFIALVPFEKIEDGLYQIGFCYNGSIHFGDRFLSKKR